MLVNSAVRGQVIAAPRTAMSEGQGVGRPLSTRQDTTTETQENTVKTSFGWVAEWSIAAVLKFYSDVHLSALKTPANSVNTRVSALLGTLATTAVFRRIRPSRLYVQPGLSNQWWGKAPSSNPLQTGRGPPASDAHGPRNARPATGSSASTLPLLVGLRCPGGRSGL
jgi:hypothetical protein